MSSNQSQIAKLVKLVEDKVKKDKNPNLYSKEEENKVISIVEWKKRKK